ncbi:MAG: N-acetylglucosamine-6-phosphate deacetylase [Syntrophorhabdaceae bacterium]
MFDIHIHGILEHDTATARPETFLEMAGLCGSLGLSAILPTIYPSSIDEMRQNMAAAKEAMRRQHEMPDAAANILGIHLEGPFLNPSMAGALNPACFLSATFSHYMDLVRGVEDIVRIVTIAPELPGAIALVRAITDRGLTVSMGHSDATYDEAKAGFQAGARGITHMFNAMRGIHHREPGIAGFALMSPDVYVEIIADPYHLSERMIEFIFRAKSPDRVIIVSDMTKGASGAAAVRNDTGRLLGGSMSLPDAANRLEMLGIDRHTIRMATTINPYTYLGLDR